MTAPNRDELTGGHWEKRGMTSVWIPDPEPITPDECADVLLAVLHRLADATVIGRITGTPCPDCGCLLRVPDELCPACAIAWCRSQEVRASWRTTDHYRPEKKEAA